MGGFGAGNVRHFSSWTCCLCISAFSLCMDWNCKDISNWFCCGDVGKGYDAGEYARRVELPSVFDTKDGVFTSRWVGRDELLKFDLVGSPESVSGLLTLFPAGSSAFSVSSGFCSVGLPVYSSSPFGRSLDVTGSAADC